MLFFQSLLKKVISPTDLDFSKLILMFKKIEHYFLKGYRLIGYATIQGVVYNKANDLLKSILLK